ncbi:hypothetical protein [Burkholderia seminalis]|uniref:hypothetical protein n=1 Tax=Burkholderia seminalis TaxID=488731 RepID=UPI0015837F90|nr:hypothetical protein [Burkholderia seminalis]MCA8306859.1 hypothetical protein [Burkholderia seminalis]MCA8435448.1 hypothetical protein [Burkholderia seminalis]
MKHLQTLAPELFAKLEKADEKILREVCYRVCDYAVTANRPVDPIVEESLGFLRSENVYRNGMLVELDELMHRLDGKYFDLKELADEMVEPSDRAR